MRLDRFVTHGVVLLIAALISGYTFSFHLSPRAGSLDAAAAAEPVNAAGDLWMGRDSSIIRPVYIPVAPLPNRAPLIYTVAIGDSLDSIAKDMKTTLRQITWSNPGLRLPLRVGQTLRLSPVPGFVVVVRRGDTLTALAAQHGMDPMVIADFNRIRGQQLTPGTLLVVPVDPTVGPNLTSGLLADPVAAEKLVCPIPGAQIIQKFGPTGFAVEPSYNGYLHFHTGVDLLAGYGTPIFAAAGGRVTAVGFAGAYGLRVEVTDSYGLVEVYAHMSAAEAAVGQEVQQGKEVGLVGSSGLSVGSHLHLQLEIGGVPSDPMPLLGCSVS